MKKYISISLIMLFTTAFSFAQTDTAAHKKELTKEEKAALKAKQESDLLAAFNEAGLTETQIAACKEVIAASNQKNNELKKQTTLTDDEKAAAKKIISDEKNAKMKEIMGEDGYRKYNAARKKQKEAASSPQ